MSETLSYRNLIAGDFPIVTAEITVTTAANMAAGTVLGVITATGKGVIVNSANVDGSQNPEAVLLVDLVHDGGAPDQTHVPIALTGEFNERSLVFGGADTVATHKAAMRNKSIFAKSSILK